MSDGLEWDDRIVLENQAVGDPPTLHKEAKQLKRLKDMDVIWLTGSWLQDQCMKLFPPPPFFLLLPRTIFKSLVMVAKLKLQTLQKTSL